MRALVVDDDEDVRKWLRIVLEAEGWEVSLAASGQEGVDALDGFEPAVIVLDYMMPGMVGTDAAAAMREKGFSGPILLFTGFLGSELKEHAEKLGLTPISKVDTASLLRHIHTIEKTLR